MDGSRNYFTTSLFENCVAELGFKLAIAGLESDYKSYAQPTALPVGPAKGLVAVMI